MSQHCAGCMSGQERTIECPLCKLTIRCTWEPCPGLTCPACAEKDERIGTLQSRLDNMQFGEDMLRAQIGMKDAEIARLRANYCEDPIDHGAVAAVREVLALTDDNHGFIDDDVARVVAERNNLRALVDVGREMTEWLEEYENGHPAIAKWRSLEGR